MGHYLTVTKWRPYFNPSNAAINKTLVWIRLPNLLAELFDYSLLMDVGNMVGKAVKVDENTLTVNRGRYARICVELDLTKTLIPMVKVNGPENLLHRIEYERLHAVCFKCGRFGHKEEECGIGDISLYEKAQEVDERRTVSKTAPSAEKPFGPWLLPASSQRRKNGGGLAPLGGQPDLPYQTRGQSTSYSMRQDEIVSTFAEVEERSQQYKQKNLMKSKDIVPEMGSRFSALQEEKAQASSPIDISTLQSRFQQALQSPAVATLTLGQKNQQASKGPSTRKGVSVKPKQKAKISIPNIQKPIQENRQPNIDPQIPIGTSLNVNEMDWPSLPTIKQPIATGNVPKPNSKQHSVSITAQDPNSTQVSTHPQSKYPKTKPPDIRPLIGEVDGSTMDVEQPRAPDPGMQVDFHNIDVIKDSQMETGVAHVANDGSESQQ